MYVGIAELQKSRQRLVQNCVTLSQQFSHKIAPFTWSSTPLFTTLKSYEVLETSHSRTMASFAMPLSSLVRMRSKHLVMKYNHHSRLVLHR